MHAKMVKKMDESRYLRQGFFVTMLYERFRADKLAILLDNGKVPLVKLSVGWGSGMMLLWQRQLDRMWSADAADSSIAEQPMLKETDGIPHLYLNLLGGS
jgi:hypothetical protein